MEYLLAIGVGVLFGCGIYLLLTRNLVRVIIGLILISNGVNLLLLTMGRLTREAPPLIEEGSKTIGGTFANPLPQALILTAIVIGFGLLAFSLVLAVRTEDVFGTVNTELLRVAEPPYPDQVPLEDNEPVSDEDQV